MKRLIILSLVCTLGVPAFLLAQQTDRAIITKADELKKHQSFNQLFKAYADQSCTSDAYTVVRFSKFGEPEKFQATTNQFNDSLARLMGKAETGDIYHIMNFQPLSCISKNDIQSVPKKLVIYIR